MKIAVLAQGSRGDVQPPLALAARLVEAGHEVTLVLPADFAAIGARLGCRTTPMPRGAREMMAQGGLVESLRRGHSIRFFREAFQREAVHMASMFEAILDGTAGAELLIVPALLEDLCVSAAEARGQRVALLFPSPLWPTASHPSLLFAGLGLPRLFNPITHAITELGAARITAIVNPARARLGLAQVGRRPSLALRRSAPPVFYWLPERVLPRPLGYGDNHVFAGFFTPPPALRAAFGEAAPPAALARFIDAGPPALYAGFGSMPVLGGRALEAISGAAARLGLRVVYGQGWSEAPPVAARAIAVPEVDHDWLFPRCAALLHHGGASTTAAGLRAGTPAVVAAVFADQPFWARRVVELGAGEALRYQRLSVGRLARALERVLHPAARARARVLAAELALEPDGAIEAARRITAEGARYPVPPRL